MSPTELLPEAVASEVEMRWLQEVKGAYPTGEAILWARQLTLRLTNCFRSTKLLAPHDRVFVRGCLPGSLRCYYWQQLGGDGEACGPRLSSQELAQLLHHEPLLWLVPPPAARAV
ncbi:hypothetical protein IT575_12070 [bacterium]|nr:hypothetical protein [bacterium]